MKKLISSFLLCVLVAQNSWAQQNCPLTNSKLTDLRTSATKLAQKISLSAQCQAFEDSVNTTNKELKGIAEKVSLFDEGEEGGDKQALALDAVAKLDGISTLLKDQNCGKQLVGMLDYVGAFVDVATGLAPFLAIYGGPAAMPWVLGPALGGAAIKSLIAFFQNKKINMRDAEQSNAFIQNSCSFYNLDLIKTSIDDLQLNRYSRIEKELADNKRFLKTLEMNAPEKPDSELMSLLKKSQKDQGRIQYLQDNFKADPVEACIYIRAYASREDGPEENNLVDRVWSNYEQTLEEGSFRLELEKKYFLYDLNDSAAVMDLSKCKELGQRWLNKISNLAQTGTNHLEKKVAEQPQVVTYEKWKNEKAKVVETITVLEAKIKFLQEMKSDGFNIEYSEIIRSHQLVQDTIFESYKYMVVLRMQGLAEAWLNVKQEDAHKEYKSFFARKKDVEKRMESIKKTIGTSGELRKADVIKYANEYVEENGEDHRVIQSGLVVDVCNQLRQTWSSWYNGLIHAEAGKNYCLTFDKVINKLDYPAVQKMCFGTSSKIGYRYNSLKNQVRDIKAIKPQADEIAEKMKLLECEGREAVSEEVLKRPF